jgi:phage/plasmid-like protein (TIGR03299 family)
MAHEFMSGVFYGGETAWHNLGIVKEGYPVNVAQAMIDGELDYTPILESSFLEDGRQAPGKIVINPKNNAILGNVSDTFRIHSHCELFSRVIDGLDGAVKISSAVALRNGEIVCLSAEVIGGQFDVLPGDSVRRFLNVWTGHTGKLATTIQLGSQTRIVCANTLAQARLGDDSYRNKIKHSKHSIITLDNAIAALHALRTDHGSQDLYRELAKRELSDLGFRKYVESVYTTPEAYKLPQWQKLERLWQGAAIGADLAGQTVWGAYNCITQFHTHMAGRSKDQGKAAAGRFESASIGSGAHIIERAEDQARILTLA